MPKLAEFSEACVGTYTELYGSCNVFQSKHRCPHNWFKIFKTSVVLVHHNRKFQLFLGDKKEEEDLGFLLDLSEGGTEVETALSLLFDQYEGDGEENDLEADGYSSFSSEKCKIYYFKICW